MNKIKVVFRYNKDFDYVEMFYYDERKDLVCFCLEEGHSTASYLYYKNDTVPVPADDTRLQSRVTAIKKYYKSSPDRLEVIEGKKLIK